MLKRATPERLTFFSDGVFAVLITVLVLELRPPAEPTYTALLALWPRWLSYAVSYLFIAIVWGNHHYLMRYARETTPRLLWVNFAHLFSMSLLPPVDRVDGDERAFCPACVLLRRRLLPREPDLLRPDLGAEPCRRCSGRCAAVLRWRSLITLGLFGSAAVIALWQPIVGLVICIACLAVYLKPDLGR